MNTIDRLTELKHQLSKVYRYTDSNTYELRSIFNSYELLVTQYIDGKEFHTATTLELSELDRYVEIFMDSSQSSGKRKEAYRIIYDFLNDCFK